MPLGVEHIGFTMSRLSSASINYKSAIASLAVSWLSSLLVSLKRGSPACSLKHIGSALVAAKDNVLFMDHPWFGTLHRLNSHVEHTQPTPTFIPLSVIEVQLQTLCIHRGPPSANPPVNARLPSCTRRPAYS